NRDVRVFRGGADQHSFRSRLQMQLGLVTVGKETCRFEHDIDVQFFPRQIGRIALLQDLNFVTAHDDVLVIVTNLTVEFAVHRIPFEQMRQSVCVSEIVDGEDLLDLLLRHGAKDVASDAPETVDCVIGHKGKLKIEGLNRYAENLKRPTPKT